MTLLHLLEQPHEALELWGIDSAQQVKEQRLGIHDKSSRLFGERKAVFPF